MGLGRQRKKGGEPKLELRVRGHVAYGELAGSTLDILGLCGVPCWPVCCRHCEGVRGREWVVVESVAVTVTK